MSADRVSEAPDDLWLRAQRAMASVAHTHHDVEATWAESCALIAHAQQVCSEVPWRQGRPRVQDGAMVPPLSDPLLSTAEPHHQEKLALHMMRDILNDFPLEMQATLLKALTVRTMVLIHDELRRPLALSA